MGVNEIFLNLKKSKGGISIGKAVYLINGKLLKAEQELSDARYVITLLCKELETKERSE